MQTFNILTRRAFLDRSFKIGMGVALSTLTNIPGLMKRALAAGIGQPGPSGKVKKVLFIWMRFGNDGLNTVIPINDPAYASSRASIEIAKDTANPSTIDYNATGPCVDAQAFTMDSNTKLLNARSPGDPTYSFDKAIPLGNGFAALHPALKFLAPVYNAGDLALIHRVAYPKQSRSHFDSQNYWENGAPNNNVVKDGILYRAMIASGLANSAPLTGVSIQSSLPLILRGSAAPMTNLTDPTRYDLLGVPTSGGDAKALAALREAKDYPVADKKSRDLLALQYQNLSSTLSIFGGLTFGDAGSVFLDDVSTDGDTPYYLFPTSNAKNGGYAAHGNNTNKYVVPNNQYKFFNNLLAAALILNKTDAIVTGTELGGFDTHSAQGGATGTHANLLRTIGWAMYALRKYFLLNSDKVTWDDVAVVTLSEFGRTTIENSDLGTDHAEAGTMFVAGGGVKGYNASQSSGVFNCGNSDLIPWASGTSGSMFGASGRYLQRVTDYRSVLGEIIRKHLGATDQQMPSIISGYQTEPELKNQNQVANSFVDQVPITGELGVV
jgi:uncharacterized protein (DUF1501 family)